MNDHVVKQEDLQKFFNDYYVLATQCAEIKNENKQQRKEKLDLYFERYAKRFHIATPKR